MRANSKQESKVKLIHANSVYDPSLVRLQLFLSLIMNMPDKSLLDNALINFSFPFNLFQNLIITSEYFKC